MIIRQWLFAFLCWILFSSTAVGSELYSRYAGAVFSGDISWMLTLEPTNDAEADLVRKFRDRFVERQAVPAFENIDDPLVREVARQFQGYWIDSLLDPGSRDAFEQTLRKNVSAMLTEAGYEISPDSRPRALIQAIRDRGWGFQAGRTPPLQDFILWRTTESKNYEVELSDRTQPVTVHFLDDFVSQGWANFATFGHTGTGGWANDDGLFCIRSAYDPESEAFQISYLKHEARHYADYQLFPDLEGADLEYRAKLTELIFLDQGQKDLLEMFVSHANGRSDAPHPLANWHVLKDVGGIVDLNGPFDESASWEAVDAGSVRVAAGELLERHNLLLFEAGSDDTTGILTSIR
ncbi:MAG: hypothetical protein ACR2QU_02055 [Gammaproteobacteria bacterium]